MSKARDIASAPIAPSTVSATELGYVDGVTSAIQTQLDAKTAKSTLTTKGDVYAATAASTPARLGVGANDTVLTADSTTATGLKWAAVSGGYSNYQLFTSSTTWTVPAGITKCAVYMIGGGGGGGSGRAQPSNFNVGGGSGGTGGVIGADSFFTVTPADVLTVTIGAGGAGGAANAITSSGVNGSNGADGSASVFGSLTVAGGIGGAGGQIYGTTPNTVAQLGTSNPILTRNNSYGGCSPESEPGVAGGPGTVVMLTQSGSLGTAGGAGSVGTNLGAGGATTLTGFGGGGGGGGSCVEANAMAGGAAIHGGGGGGGNARSVGSTTTTSGAGGAGAVNRGGGGGGSGAAQKTATGATATSPAGGNGGSGFVAIFY